jgi:hypothetical protein
MQSIPCLCIEDKNLAVTFSIILEASVGIDVKWNPTWMISCSHFELVIHQLKIICVLLNHFLNPGQAVDDICSVPTNFMHSMVL